ncbi:MAG: phenylpyruvate tautomerase MIF-related protein [Gammaproteobacteria bacterium]|nr:phenylpyruvate tautomerase MIF-related protein [Gammaproteobacteria bacterium]
MPVLNIKTNIKIENKASLAESASKTTARLLGKPETYVMINIEDDQCLSFAGNNTPCALLSLKSLGLAENLTASFSKALCEFINTNCEIDESRIYIEFINPERHMWGWDGRTF